MLAPARHGGVLHVLVGAACLVIIVAGLHAAEAIVVPCLLAIFITVLCAPFLIWLQRHRVPNWLALTVVLAGMLLVVLVVTTIIGGSLDSFRRSLPHYQQQLMHRLTFALDTARAHGIAVPADLTALVSPGVLMQLTVRLLSTLRNMLADSLLIVLIIGFILAEATALPAKMQAAFGRHTTLISTAGQFSVAAQRYLMTRMAISAVNGVSWGIWLAVLGVDFAAMWGVLMFIMYFVPTIGAVLALLPPLMLALVMFGVVRALLVVAGFLLFQLVYSTILEPRLLGNSLGLSPLVVFLSLVFWGWVLGPIGMILSVPLTSLLKIAFESSAHLRGYAILLGPCLPATDEHAP